MQVLARPDCEDDGTYPIEGRGGKVGKVIQADHNSFNELLNAGDCLYVYSDVVQFDDCFDDGQDGHEDAEAGSQGQVNAVALPITNADIYRVCPFEGDNSIQGQPKLINPQMTQMN